MTYTKGEWKVFIADHFVQVHTGKTTITLEKSEENIANAQLIASAPALYEALKEARVTLKVLQPDGSAVIREIDEALAKVDGSFQEQLLSKIAEQPLVTEIPLSALVELEGFGDREFFAEDEAEGK